MLADQGVTETLRVFGQCTVILNGRVIGLTAEGGVAAMASDLAPGSVINVSLNDERAVVMPGPIALRGTVRPPQSRFGAGARPIADPTRVKAKAARKAAHVTRRKEHG